MLLLTDQGDEMFWMKDAHITAISLLYDIAVFSYITTARKWYAFNEQRRNGYVWLADAAPHNKQCATKYSSQSRQHTELLDEVTEHLNKRSMDLLLPNMKQLLSHLILTDCSHRAFISKQELTYHLMNLSAVDKSFPYCCVVSVTLIAVSNLLTWIAPISCAKAAVDLTPVVVV